MFLGIEVFMKKYLVLVVSFIYFEDLHASGLRHPYSELKEYVDTMPDEVRKEEEKAMKRSQEKIRKEIEANRGRAFTSNNKRTFQKSIDESRRKTS